MQPIYYSSHQQQSPAVRILLVAPQMVAAPPQVMIMQQQPQQMSVQHPFSVYQQPLQQSPIQYQPQQQHHPQFHSPPQMITFHTAAAHSQPMIMNVQQMQQQQPIQQQYPQHTQPQQQWSPAPAPPPPSYQSVTSPAQTTTTTPTFATLAAQRPVTQFTSSSPSPSPSPPPSSMPLLSPSPSPPSSATSIHSPILPSPQQLHSQPVIRPKHIAQVVPFSMAPQQAWAQARPDLVHDIKLRQQTNIQPDARIHARVRALEDLAPDSPVVRWITSTGIVLVDMFKLCIASLLSIFIPQLCPGNNENEVGGNGNCTSITYAHDCSFSENFRCLTPYNQFVLAWNMLCLGALGMHYILVYKRERFMMKNFTESLTEGRLSLRDELRAYPTLQIRLHWMNKAVFNTSVAVIGMQLINIVSSAYLVFFLYPNGYKTYTSFVSSLLLIALVLYTCVHAAYLGLRHELAYSCVKFECVSYNMLQHHVRKGE